MTSHQVTTFPATADGEPSLEATAERRPRRVPTSLQVVGVVDPSPRQRATLDVQGLTSPAW